MARHPAAFINAIADEGTKVEAVRHLQETWDELCDLQHDIARHVKIASEEASARIAAEGKLGRLLELVRLADSDLNAAEGIVLGSSMQTCGHSKEAVELGLLIMEPPK